jgi:hypothetical protein
MAAGRLVVKRGNGTVDTGPAKLASQKSWRMPGLSPTVAGRVDGWSSSADEYLVSEEN